MIKLETGKVSTPRCVTNTLLEVGRKFVIKIFTTFYRRVVLVIRSLNDSIPDLRPSLPVAITILIERDLEAYKIFRPDQSIHIIHERLKHGDRCFAVWHEGNIVHAGWVTTKQGYVPYLHRDMILRPGDIRLYDHYTLRAYRGCGLANARGAHVLRQYREEGCRRAIGIVAIENKAAFGPVKALGYRSIGMFKCIRLGPWQWEWKQTWSNEPLPILTKEKLVGE